MFSHRLLNWILSFHKRNVLSRLLRGGDYSNFKEIQMSNGLKLLGLWALSFLLLLNPGLSLACSVCGCGDPLASSGSAHPMADSWRLDFEDIYLTASALGDAPGTNQTESLRQTNLNATLSYAPTDDLTLVAMFPLVQKYWSLDEGPGNIDAGVGSTQSIADTGTPFGIGDINVGFRYFFWQETDFKTKEHQALALSAGTYLPTGGTNVVSGITGQPIDTHAQLGTGALGLYAGLLYNHVWDGFTLSANANVVYHTQAFTTDTTSSVYEYTFGTSYTGGISGQLKVSDPIAVGLAVEGRYTSPDSEPNPNFANPDGSNVSGQPTWNTPNTGGTVIDLSPSIYWNATGTAVLYGKVQIPTITNFIGQQTLGPTYIFGTQFLIN
jgi:hypothetical protein